MPKMTSQSNILAGQSPTRRKWRMFNDKAASHLVRLGGLSVIFAITLIFFYLLSVVIPLFEGAEIEKRYEYQIPALTEQQTLHYVIDEQGEVAIRLSEDGIATSFNLANGEVFEQVTLTNEKITSFGRGDPGSGNVVLGLANGSAIAVKLGFKTVFTETGRTVSAEYTHILGEDPIEVDEEGLALTHITLQSNDESTSIVAINESSTLRITKFLKEDSLFEDEVEFEQVNATIGQLDYDVQKLLIDNVQRLMYVADNVGAIFVYDISDIEDVRLYERKVISSDNQPFADIQLAAGGVSLIIAQQSDSVSQWFPVRDENNDYSLALVREFHLGNSLISQVTPEYFRKEFFSMSESGELGIHHLTAHQTLIHEKVSDVKITQLVISPRSNYALLEDAEGKIQVWHVINEYPEVSWSSLWGKVWYEGYDEADYIWQSSAADSDFEAKLSLVPLSFGTLKAAFYAMMVAVPLAIFGAIYTAYFMSSRLRQTVKPTIEIMEALPTVILGFLAGLWFAPFLETHMPGVFAVSLLLPLGVLLFAYLWYKSPKSLTGWVPDGWQPILLIPIIILIVWGAIAVSPAMETAFFGGNMPIWLNQEMGISYDQRNAMVVGFAMGFAVIPTIYSIAEDAIFGVPKHLTNGSLALGATPWQTLTRVVILTASPGIFSAVMIGFGRAVGETMIVLMATGNTPILDFNIFEGMRTLSANIAVEMPEAEVGSTHYRVLFLAALILFIFTFMFNTIAELVRQRLRKKYSSL